MAIVGWKSDRKRKKKAENGLAGVDVEVDYLTV